MRQDPVEFAASNLAAWKSPRLVVRIVFDTASIYVTSDASMTNVPGTPLLGYLQNVSAVSQEINPDEARSTIGSMTFSLVDIDSDFTEAIRDQLQTELQNLRGRTVQLRLGYSGDYNDTQLLFTQQVKACEYADGAYRVTCNDIQRETRKDIFEPVSTRLRLSVGEDDATIPVDDTTGFEMVAHGPSFSDAPSATVGYIRLEDEVIRYTGTTSDSFTGCSRGVFNTSRAAHEVEPGASVDRQPEVEEWIYLELPGPKLALAVLTGALDGDSASVPDHWSTLVDSSLVDLDQFRNIGPDLWDTTDDAATMVLRFAGLQKTDGKRFLEEQIYQPLGLYSPVLSDGSLGLRRMSPILVDAPYVVVLNEASFVQVGALLHDYDSLLNVFTVDWNWDPIGEKFTRRRRIVDQASIDVHGAGDTKVLSWEGIHGSRHTNAVLLQRTDSIRDRYAGPPLRLPGQLLHSYNRLEVGDVVRVQLEHVRDYTGAAGAIDRSFEIQRIAVDQVAGTVDVALFGSSQPSSILPPDTGTALPDSWYNSAGTELSTVCTIVAGVIQPGTYSLTGNASLTNAGAVFYYLGDLELADGATLEIDDNVQLRIRGFFTINGDIDGAGRGKAGATDDSVFANSNHGVQGFIGNTRGWGGINQPLPIPEATAVRRWDAIDTVGLYNSFPLLEMSVQSGALVGLPDDIRGTSGGIGGRVVRFPTTPTVHADGGDGGDGGAGLAIIARGASLGASATIDVSGGDSGQGNSVTLSGVTYRSGSGAPGGPGAVLCLIDGSSPSLPSLLSGIVGQFGTAPTPGPEPINETGDGVLNWSSDAVQPLAGYNTVLSGDISSSLLRVQRLAPEQTSVEDVAVIAPASFAVATNAAASAHILTNTPPPAGVITEYLASLTDDRADSVVVGSSVSGFFEYIPAPGLLIYYWARNRNLEENTVSTFSPATTTTTIIGQRLVVTGESYISDPSFIRSTAFAQFEDIPSGSIDPVDLINSHWGATYLADVEIVSGEGIGASTGNVMRLHEHDHVGNRRVWSVGKPGLSTSLTNQWVQLSVRLRKRDNVALLVGSIAEFRVASIADDSGVASIETGVLLSYTAINAWPVDEWQEFSVNVQVTEPTEDYPWIGAHAQWDFLTTGDVQFRIDVDYFNVRAISNTFTETEAGSVPAPTQAVGASLKDDGTWGDGSYKAQTPAELSGSVTPVNPAFDPGDALRLNFLESNSGADNLTALELIADVVSQGGYREVILPEGTFDVSGQADFPASVIIRGAGMGKTVINGGSTDAPIRVIPAKTLIGTVSTAPGQFASTVTLSTTSGLSVGDYVQFLDTAGTWTYDIDRDTQAGQSARITAISGSDITIDDFFWTDLSTSCEVYRLPDVTAQVSDLTISKDGVGGQGISMNNVLFPVVQRVEIIGTDVAGINLNTGVGGYVGQCLVKDHGGSSTGYGIYLQNWTRMLVHGNTLNNGRAGIDISGVMPSRFIDVIANQTYDHTVRGLGSHAASQFVRYIDNQIHASQSLGIYHRGPDWEATGNKFYGVDDSAISCQYSGGKVAICNNRAFEYRSTYSATQYVGRGIDLNFQEDVDYLTIKDNFIPSENDCIRIRATNGSGEDTPATYTPTINNLTIDEPRLDTRVSSSRFGVVIGDGVNGPIAALVDPIINIGHCTAATMLDIDSNITVTRPRFKGVDIEVRAGAGAIPLTSEHIDIQTDSADALTLADGYEGQELFLTMSVDAGDGTLTPTNLANGTTVTFDDVGDCAHLRFFDGAWHFMGGTATLA